MRPGAAIILKERAPLEKRRQELVEELARVDARLAEIGSPSAANAALRFIRANPGSLGDDVAAFSGVNKTALSRLAAEGRLRSEYDGGARKAGARARWWIVEVER